MNKKSIAGIVALVVIGGAVSLAVFKPKPIMDSNSGTSTPQAAPAQPVTNDSTQSEVPSDQSSSQAGAMNVTVKANDASSTPETIEAKKGQTVNLTLSVLSDGTYHGGLEFTSSDPSIDTGPISPGSSKTISFTADKTFSFTPWWPQKSVKKDYVVTVNVQ